MKFSPKGTYLFSVFPGGVQAWGAENFERINRFIHPGVRLIDFSPNEKFMVTLSPEPISALPDDHPGKSQYPFGPESEGHKLVIWDLQTGLPARTFALPPNLEKTKTMPWPLIKWSFDDKYCARVGPDALAIYDTSDFSLLEKKLVKIEGIVDFEFAPAGVRFATNRKSDPLEAVLAYWTPEQGNQTAKVSVMQVPTKKVLRTVNLNQVSDVKMFWQQDAKYLCCKVDRHTKSKKTMFTNLEIFQLFERDIPVEKIELSEIVLSFQWEPKGHRFVTISKTYNPNDNPAMANNTVSFYDIEEAKVNSKLASVLKKWVAFKVMPEKYSNDLLFSPKGRFIVVSTIKPIGSVLEFYDLDFDGEKPKDQSSKVSSNLKLIRTQEQNGLSALKWDPSGRFVAAWSSAWKHKIENGYKIYDQVGQLIREELVDGFKDFNWRPRPASLLSASDRKKVRKNLKEYSVQFDEIDTMEEDAEQREIILKRKSLLSEWTSWRESVIAKLEKLGYTEHQTKRKAEVIEEIKEEVLEETEEVVE
ncbi:unnamed protein product [Ambrosiozyma monospora]|uniref:Unnamed protein product n=1 Tax=Ambrosiozyma monospora TaxID=43982 RepID=A0ACB5T200_AMBMO|nr:unnamed protein product [Ambrosiozyma monospora]